MRASVAAHCLAAEGVLGPPHQTCQSNLPAAISRGRLPMPAGARSASWAGRRSCYTVRRQGRREAGTSAAGSGSAPVLAHPAGTARFGGASLHLRQQLSCPICCAPVAPKVGGWADLQRRIAVATIHKHSMPALQPLQPQKYVLRTRQVRARGAGGVGGSEGSNGGLPAQGSTCATSAHGLLRLRCMRGPAAQQAQLLTKPHARWCRRGSAPCIGQGGRPPGRQTRFGSSARPAGWRHRSMQSGTGCSGRQGGGSGAGRRHLQAAAASVRARPSAAAPRE